MRPSRVLTLSGRQMGLSDTTLKNKRQRKRKQTHQDWQHVTPHHVEYGGERAIVVGIPKPQIPVSQILLTPRIAPAGAEMRLGDSVILLILELRRCQNRSHPAKLDRSDSARIGAVEITLVYR